MPKVNHTPGPTGLPRYLVRVEGDGEWSHDSISAALDHAARRVYMGPAAKVREAQQTLSEGRTYRYAYGFKQVEIEPTGPEIPPSVVAAAPDLLAACTTVLDALEFHYPSMHHSIGVLRSAIAKATGKENYLPVSKEGA